MNITEYLSDISLNYFALIRKLSSKFELTLSQTLVLLYIPFDGITISDLSDKLGVDISTMTRNIQRIEKKGLIIRMVNENDRRSIKIQLSNRGRTVSESLTQQISINMENILKKYNFDEVQKIQNALESLGWELYLYRTNL
tara:strand:- start:174 stop:596 length:423 start_codon:yes stop_codon:yes gene_type:complete